MDNSTPIISKLGAEIFQKESMERLHESEQTKVQNITLNKIAEKIKNDFINYKALTGKEVICRYLIDKYHWRPKEVSALTYEELKLLLIEYQDG